MMPCRVLTTFLVGASPVDWAARGLTHLLLTVNKLQPLKEFWHFIAERD